jgi:hypothetical protein
VGFNGRRRPGELRRYVGGKKTEASLCGRKIQKTDSLRVTSGGLVNHASGCALARDFINATVT